MYVRAQMHSMPHRVKRWSCRVQLWWATFERMMNRLRAAREHCRLICIVCIVWCWLWSTLVWGVPVPCKFQPLLLQLTSTRWRNHYSGYSRARVIRVNLVRELTEEVPTPQWGDTGWRIVPQKLQEGKWLQGNDCLAGGAQLAEALHAALSQTLITIVVVNIAIEGQAPLLYGLASIWILAVPVPGRPRCQCLAPSFSLWEAQGTTLGSMHIYLFFSRRTLRMRREAQVARRSPPKTCRKSLRKHKWEFWSRLLPIHKRMKRRPPSRLKWMLGKVALKEMDGAESSRKSLRNDNPRQAPSPSSFAQVRYQLFVFIYVGYRPSISVWVLFAFPYVMVIIVLPVRLMSVFVKDPRSPLRGYSYVFGWKPLRGSLMQVVGTVLYFVKGWKRVSLVRKPLRGPTLNHEQPQLALSHMSFWM